MRRPRDNKTRKSVAKRFKITGTGMVLFRGAGRRHLLSTKNSKRRRRIEKVKIVDPTDVYRIKLEAVLPRTRSLAEVKAMAAIMEKLVGPHSRTEDELFIDPLKHYFDQIGKKETFHQEHEMIEETLAKAHKARDIKSARQLLLGAVMASRKHFFPMAERILSAKTLSELGETWLRRREVSAKY